MTERDYIRLKEEARREYQQRLDAIETVWAMVTKRPVAAARRGVNINAAKFERNGDSGPRGVLRDIVREAIRVMHNDFTIRDVRGVLSRSGSEIGHNQLSGTL